MARISQIQAGDFRVFQHYSINGWYSGESYNRCTGETDERWNSWDGAIAELRKTFSRQLTEGELTLVSLSLKFGPCPALKGYDHGYGKNAFPGLIVLDRGQVETIISQWLAYRPA